MGQSRGVEDMAEAIAARHGVAAEKVQPGPVGGANHVFLLGDDLVLRVPRARRDAHRLLAEAAIIPAARRGGVLTPAVVEFDASVPYLLTERVRGADATVENGPNPRLYEELGRELAKLHQIPPPPSAARHWSAPPASRLLGLLRFFATSPAWRDLT